MLKRLTSPSHQLLALWKWLLSFRKTNWSLNDYPVFVRNQDADGTDPSSRLKLVPYSASIVNWYTLSGSGNTAAEAIAELEKNFDYQKTQRRKDRKNFPGPGTHVPIEFAEAGRVEAHRGL